MSCVGCRMLRYAIIPEVLIMLVGFRNIRREKKKTRGKEWTEKEILTVIEIDQFGAPFPVTDRLTYLAEKVTTNSMH